MHIRLPMLMHIRLPMPLKTTAALCLVLSAMVAALACGGKKPPVLRPAPPPPTQTPSTQRSPAPPEPVMEPPIVPPEPVKEDAIASASLDDLNRSSPLKPLFFAFDSAEIDAAGQAVLDANAATLKKYPSWTLTLEGHGDE